MNEPQSSTHAIGTVNPLMQPIEWHGQWYHTSQYFHLSYRTHMAEMGWKPKHARHDNFLQTIRAIPLFHHYVTQEDIIILERQKCPENFRTLFRNNQQKLLFLLNATAQAGLTQHLDDPASMSIAYQINQRAAHQSAPKLSDTFPELRAIVELVEGVAQARIAAAAAQREAENATTKANLALAQQTWLTIREYVYLHQLLHQCPEAQWPAFGRYLTGYCMEHNVPIRKQPIYGKPYESEQSYHVEVIAQQLAPWLTRQHAQPTLRAIRNPEQGP